MKKMSDCYLYQVADYQREIYKYIMRAERIDKKSDSFADIIYDVKMRQVDPVILKVLLSNRVILCLDTKGMSRAFKVLYMKDPKDAKKYKAFIDCSGIIRYENGRYICKDIGKLISYTISAMTYVLVDKLNTTVLADTILVQSSTEAFIDMMLYVLGYLKVPVTYGDNKEKMAYVLAEYYLYSIMERYSYEESNISVAKKASKISDNRSCAYLHTLFADIYSEENLGRFDLFVKKFAEVFMEQKDDVPTKQNRLVLTPDVVAQRWMYVFGAGTFLGLEYFPSFATTLTDCYVGAYVNQQNTIEKIVGKNVVKFTNELLKLGSENA